MATKKQRIAKAFRYRYYQPLDEYTQLGICGEPSSVAFCDGAGLDYLSNPVNVARGGHHIPAKTELKRSAVADNVSGKSQLSEVRTSSGMFIRKNKDPIVAGIEEKIATWTFLPKENGEDIQVLRYESGQKYDPHFDYFSDPVNVARGGHRIATVLMYLSDVEKGGETVFPSAEENSRHKTTKPDDLSECAKKGIAVKPKKGDALLFFSLYPTAVPDTMSLHGGCPVLEGEKWSATKWIHVDSFDKIIDNGGSCKDENENCERWAALGECTKNKEYMVGTPELPGYCRRSCKLC